MRVPFLLEAPFLCMSGSVFARDMPVFVYDFSLFNEVPQ